MERELDPRTSQDISRLDDARIVSASESAASARARPAFYARYVKRALDLVASLGALVVLSPVLALAALFIRLEDGGRAIFRQRRIGRDGQPFTLLKFRSMPESAGDVPSAQAGAIRVTRVGRIIRRTNIDELPQLVNIMRGDMSVVGPRPALLTQERLVELRRRNGALACVPGLTGLAQIRAYTGMPEEEKAHHDAEYAATVSLGRDIGIVLRTISYLLRPPPIY